MSRGLGLMGKRPYPNSIINTPPVDVTIRKQTYLTNNLNTPFSKGSRKREGVKRSASRSNAGSQRDAK